MYTLRRLADSGRTIVLVTHATANISQCDHVAFMSEGGWSTLGHPPRHWRSSTSAAAISPTSTPSWRASPPQDADRWLVVQRDLQAEYDAWLRDHRPPTTDHQVVQIPVVGRQSSVVRLRPAELWEMRFRAHRSISCTWPAGWPRRLCPVAAAPSEWARRSGCESRRCGISASVAALPRLDRAKIAVTC